MGNNLETLYPPIVDTYAPVFIINEGEDAVSNCRVYFSISPYNTKENISTVLVSIKKQESNQSALKNDFLSEIYLANIKIDNNKQENNKYYIEIPSAVIKEGKFLINEFYKIQLSFSTAFFSEVNSNNPYKTEEWLIDNFKNSSEWSTVVLAHGISQPSIKLNPFDENADRSFINGNSTLHLVGRMEFSEGDKEELSFYKIKVINNENKKTLFQSEKIYPNEKNQINYIVPILLEDGEYYSLEIFCETRNLFQLKKTYNFYNIQNPIEKLPVDIIVEPNEFLGSLRIELKAKTKDLYTQQIVFRRSSDKTNFTIWEDVYTIDLQNEELNQIWFDKTVESGVWYKYCVETIIDNKRGVATIQKEPIILDLKDDFLIADNQQLRICFDPKLQGYGYQIGESKIETLGSQFPFVKRDGEKKYREFDLSGLITFHMDRVENVDSKFLLEENFLSTFANDEKLFGSLENKEYYENYRKDKHINDYNDFIKEKRFRELVVDFLYKDNVKLLKTRTEGNILVKLSEISFAPKEELGRMLYSFSAKAIEIDECNINNLKKYHIFNELTFYKDSKKKNIDKKELGQYTGKILPGQDFLQDILYTKYQNKYGSEQKIIIEKVTKAQINFLSPSKLIKESSAGKLEYVPTFSKNNLEEKYLLNGNIITINNIDIFVPKGSSYELVKNSEIFSLTCPEEEEFVIDYVVEFNIIKNYVNYDDSIFYYNKIGQEWGIFEPKESIVRRLYNKYKMKVKNFYFKLLSLNGVSIEADENTVFFIKNSNEQKYQRIVMNETESIHYYNQESIIDGLYFIGKHFKILSKKEDYDKIFYNQYQYLFETGEQIENVQDVINPQEHGIYSIVEKEYYSLLEEQVPDIIGSLNTEGEEDSVFISSDQNFGLYLVSELLEKEKIVYYNGKWCSFTKDGDLLCPVEAIINYWCETIKGERGGKKEKK